MQGGVHWGAVLAFTHHSQSTSDLLYTGLQRPGQRPGLHNPNSMLAGFQEALAAAKHTHIVVLTGVLTESLRPGSLPPRQQPPAAAAAAAALHPTPRRNPNPACRRGRERRERHPHIPRRAGPVARLRPGRTGCGRGQSLGACKAERSTRGTARVPFPTHVPLLPHPRQPRQRPFCAIPASCGNFTRGGGTWRRRAAPTVRTTRSRRCSGAWSSRGGG